MWISDSGEVDHSSVAFRAFSTRHETGGRDASQEAINEEVTQGPAAQARGISAPGHRPNVQDLHADEANEGCLFQVASQFNLLEMVSPDVTPEHGVGIYENDFTQGPACAIAAGAGTIYRNYFAVTSGQVGQSARNQIDCLADIGVALGNSEQELWEMRNGYALASHEGLIGISRRLDTSSEKEIDDLRRLLRIGIQWNTQVTIEDSRHTVTQAYCSALPVAYASYSPDLWESFARLILDASYEATICSAILNSLSNGNNRVFLTLLGGGAFGNRAEWIMASIQRALRIYEDWPLEVAIVSYGASQQPVQQLMRILSGRRESGTRRRP